MPGLHYEGWPVFMRNDPVSDRYWPSLYTTFADFQIVFYDDTDRVIAVGHSIPVVWDGTVEGLPSRWDLLLEQGIHDHERHHAPTTLSALALVIAKSHRGQDLSSKVIREMKSVAAKHSLTALIAPVRLTLKSRYPLTPMEHYVQWKQADGSPFDPWLRVHWKLGAEFLCIAHQFFVITGTVAEWEEWTEMRFPQSGAYIVPGALQPVVIDCEQNQGSYEEANVWMRHPITVSDATPKAKL